MCKPTQAKGNQTNGPMLNAPQASRVLLRYLENGHITQPSIPPNKPSSGQVFVYATTQPQDDDKFTAIHGQWTPNGTGGDQRGFLLNTTSFDDGQCFQFDPTRHTVKLPRTGVTYSAQGRPLQKHLIVGVALSFF